MSEATGIDASHPNTFPVDDVTPALTPICTEPAHEHVTKRFRRKVIFLPGSKKPVINGFRGLAESKKFTPELRARYESTMVNRCHPLIDAVATAFSEHRPLILSPDSIWMAIEQGFAHHVTENAETLRSRFVRHHGKTNLSTAIHDLNGASFETAVSDIASQIRNASNPVLLDALICDFSTTTPVIRTASEIVLLDCYSSYFTYSIMCVCGIPKITVTGAPGDWQCMRDRIEVLETFDLGWWVARLRPILDEFIRTAEGRPSLQFWRAIYKPKQAYGAQTVTGWIADLFPYLNDRPERKRNHIFQYEREDWALPVDKGVTTRIDFGEPGAARGVSQRSFPSGLASVPVKLTLPDNSAHDIDLVAGFFGVEQDPHDLALSPVISWAVAERVPSTPILV